MDPPHAPFPWQQTMEQGIFARSKLGKTIDGRCNWSKCDWCIVVASITRRNKPLYTGIIAIVHAT